MDNILPKDLMNIVLEYSHHKKNKYDNLLEEIKLCIKFNKFNYDNKCNLLSNNMLKYYIFPSPTSWIKNKKHCLDNSYCLKCSLFKKNYMYVKYNYCLCPTPKTYVLINGIECYYDSD